MPALIANASDVINEADATTSPLFIAWLPLVLAKEKSVRNDFETRHARRLR
jgi:hypothetical protein